jgi:hypothetical protein
VLAECREQPLDQPRIRARSAHQIRLDGDPELLGWPVARLAHALERLEQPGPLQDPRELLPGVVTPLDVDGHIHAASVLRTRVLSVTPAFLTGQLLSGDVRVCTNVAGETPRSQRA